MRDDYQTRAMNLRLAAPAPRTVADRGMLMDESAFHAFYQQTSGPLLRYLLGVTRRRDLAEDLLQESYCRFLTASVPEMDPRQASSYLFRIATNLMHDRWRQLQEDSLPDSAPEAASPAPPFERRLGVRQAFGRLKPRERQLLWLAYVQGCNHQEIAHCTGLGAGSIRLLLFRARRKLAELIGGSLRRGDPAVTNEVGK
ncbi:MAG: RNA polymerase sigma factor [Terriglobales bacterium]